MRKIILMSISAACLVLAVGWYLFSRSSTRTTAITQQPAPLESAQAFTASTTPSQTSSATYTLAHVAEHKDATSCWAVISGSVYDLTNWISRHPGGPGRILSICGTDATKAFENQHGGEQRPESILATFKIGTLGAE